MTYLLQPLTTGNLTLKNRLIMPPMATSKAEVDGKVSKEILDYYEEKSKGGYISLIIIEHSFIIQRGKANHNQLSVADKSMLEGLKLIAEVIHKNGSKAVMQINHAGSATNEEITGLYSVGPSGVVNPRRDILPKELTEEEIHQIVLEFTDAALLVKEAGFDGVEIHSAHGYLLNQFFSPLTNKREDQYGGIIQNRIKIHLEVIKSIRKAVGKDFTVLLRLGAADYLEGGTTIEDSKVAAIEFEKAGVDILDISGGFNGFMILENNEQGYFQELSNEIKKIVNIPVILTGGITEPEAAEKLLMDEKADLIGVGRAIYKDSTWAEKTIKSLNS
ncbi:NADH:flavin oxidoreductase [Clostridium grantii]|uniref:2,4-dienoyl-CoA reductase n=1 Tax=Clostridium grantii DSM 8605 TaxID=1121316 RepID=A0A1M5X962_9CLOT|nr:NADH:flavin oxidoreductase [Clostridium grantii]SHH96064.1 2,4-dienoyl-CoA reductase [Clostridium grantii DSM 8605]